MLMLSESVRNVIHLHPWIANPLGVEKWKYISLMKGNKSRVHFLAFVIKALEKKVSREINVFVSLHDAMTSKTEVKNRSLHFLHEHFRLFEAD